MQADDLVISGIDFGATPQLSIALTAVDFAPVVTPFAAITVGEIEIGVASFVQIGAPPISIVASAGDSPARAGRGRAIPIEELLGEIDPDDEDEAVSLLLVLWMLDDSRERAAAAAIAAYLSDRNQKIAATVGAYLQSGAEK